MQSCFFKCVCLYRIFDSYDTSHNNFRHHVYIYPTHVRNHRFNTMSLFNNLHIVGLLCKEFITGPLQMTTAERRALLTCMMSVCLRQLFQEMLVSLL